MEFDRRAFLKRAGLGSIALGTLPTLISSLAAPASAQGGTNFTFLALKSCWAGRDTCPAGAHTHYGRSRPFRSFKNSLTSRGRGSLYAFHCTRHTPTPNSVLWDVEG